MMGSPIPLEAALQNDSRPVAPKVEARAQVDAEPRPQFPVAPHKQLMHLRLSARRDVDALNLTVVFERWRKGLRFHRTSRAGSKFHPRRVPGPCIARSKTGLKTTCHRANSRSRIGRSSTLREFSSYRVF